MFAESVRSRLWRIGYGKWEVSPGGKKIMGDEVTLQVFEGTEGIPTNAEVVFLGKSPTLKVSEQLAGRFFNAFGDPIDGDRK